MKVTIPSTREHNGFGLVTFEVDDYCPKCGDPRGKIFGTHSFDGSRRLNVDGWKNECGHIDKYIDVRKEGKKVKYKDPQAFNTYEQ